MGMNKAWVARQEASDESRRFHERDRLALWTMDVIAGLMEEKEVSKADLARKIGSSRSYVTQVFSGSKNPTLGTVADLAWALGYRACMKFEPLRSNEFMSVPVQSCRVLALPKRQVIKNVIRLQSIDEESCTSDRDHLIAIGAS